MEEMEEKLQAYRQNKKVQLDGVKKERKSKDMSASMRESLNHIKQKISDMLIYANNLFVKSNQKAELIKPDNRQRNLKLSQQKNGSVGCDLDADDENDVMESSQVFHFKLILKILLWFVLFGIFIKLEFGLVYLVTSLLVIIYLNTRKTKRKTKEISAYSVFNPNLERIDGTFTAEQMEKNLFKMF
jgi:hypothetical protein